MKKITALILAVTFLGMGLAFADQPVSVGNKHCPVTGEEVGKMGTPLTFEYKGKAYNICCLGCKKAFTNDPEKYSKIAEDDAKITK